MLNLDINIFFQLISLIVLIGGGFYFTGQVTQNLRDLSKIINDHETRIRTIEGGNHENRIKTNEYHIRTIEKKIDKNG